MCQTTTSKQSKSTRQSKMYINTSIHLINLYCCLISCDNMALTTMRSQFLNESIYIVPSIAKPGCVYKFSVKKDTVYRCCRCRELGKQRCITVVDGELTSRKNPDEGHHEDCVPIEQSVVHAQQLDREMRADVRTSGKRSREAFSSMMSSVAKRFKSSDEQAEVISNLPSFGEVRRQLARHRAVRCTPVPDPLDIPDVLRVTLRGRQVDVGDENYDEKFLLYSGQGAKLQYGLQIGQLFCYQFPSPYAMEQLWALSCAYLDRVSYLVIGA